MHATDPADPEAKALACYGLWLPGRERMLLRFVAGRPVSPVTCAFLAWAAQQMAAEDVRVLVVSGSNMSGSLNTDGMRCATVGETMIQVPFGMKYLP